MRILGIDPGSRATGYALVELRGSSIAFVEAGVLPCRRTSALGGRLAAIDASLDALVARCRPDESAVEDLFHALNARSSLTLAHARGVILCVLARRGVPISEYTPLQVKKAVSGYGLADKEALRALLERLLSAPRSLFVRDASDAVAVAVCHAQAVPLRNAVASAERRRDPARPDEEAPERAARRASTHPRSGRGGGA